MQLNTESRVELGFIGAHADIGGGYSEGDLSDVALMWMVQRALGADVKIDLEAAENQDWNKVTVPVIHKSNSACLTYKSIPCIPTSDGRGRYWKYQNDLYRPHQRDWTGYGMDTKTSEAGYFDERYSSRAGEEDDPPQRGIDHEGNRTLVGLVDPKYSQWLSDNYGLDIEINENDLDQNGNPPPIRNTR